MKLSREIFDKYTDTVTNGFARPFKQGKYVYATNGKILIRAHVDATDFNPGRNDSAPDAALFFEIQINKLDGVIWVYNTKDLKHGLRAIDKNVKCADCGEFLLIGLNPERIKERSIMKI